MSTYLTQYCKICDKNIIGCPCRIKYPILFNKLHNEENYGGTENVKIKKQRISLLGNIMYYYLKLKGGRRNG